MKSVDYKLRFISSDDIEEISDNVRRIVKNNLNTPVTDIVDFIAWMHIKQKLII